MQRTEWRKSTRCAADKPQCVEVNYPRDNAEPDRIFIRDSKNPAAGILNIPVGSLRGLVNRQ